MSTYHEVDPVTGDDPPEAREYEPPPTGRQLRAFPHLPRASKGTVAWPPKEVGEDDDDATRNVDAICCDLCEEWIGHGIFDGDYGQPRGEWKVYWLLGSKRWCEDCAPDDCFPDDCFPPREAF